MDDTKAEDKVTRLARLGLFACWEVLFEGLLLEFSADSCCCSKSYR